ncbi:helix-turn-helix domain-containing protein, partial [Niveibacterium sp.]|uniref:helix-turn-helix domain-containing protein n=1 Tax=Niveibacterium sp. TaxID=2017444 RepID=UPI0035AD8595
VEKRSEWVDAMATSADSLLVQNPGGVFRSMVQDFEAILVRRALTAAGGCRIEAARLLGINRTTVSRKIESLGLTAFATPSRSDSTDRARSPR